VRASFAAASRSGERRARVFSSVCVRKCERWRFTQAPPPQRSRRGCAEKKRFGRGEDGTRAGEQVSIKLRAALRCKVARVSIVLPPLCARIGARRGRMSTLQPQPCAIAARTLCRASA
jgi:hypothetical protein